MKANFICASLVLCIKLLLTNLIPSEFSVHTVFTCQPVHVSYTRTQHQRRWDVCHQSRAMECVAFNVYVRLLTLPFFKFQCSYGACGKSTVVLSSKLTSPSSNVNCYGRRQPT